jgi:pyruvate ferredoxin oxidoreductase alpha subunit
MAEANLSVMEGSMAIAQAIKACRPAVISAYPITPQTHIIEILAHMVANGELDAEYIRADSEFSAISIIAGASATGVRAYTASASQGLLLMTEVIYYLAGSRLPVVLTGANRQVSAPIGLQPDHQDTLSFRDAGMIELYVESAQEAYDTHIQAFKIAEDHQVLLPVMVCVDGYVLTHVYEPVRTFDQAAVDAFLPPYAPLHYLTPDNPMIFGSYVDETNALEFRYMTHQAMQHAKMKIEAVAREYQATFGLYHGGLIDTYGTEDAEVILVAMGSTVSTLREAVDYLRAEGTRVGLVKIRCYRPFPSEALRQAVGKAGAVVALDRALSMGFQGVVAADVKAALYDAPQRPLVLGMLAGYGGREVTLDTARTIVDRARRAIDAGVANAEAEFIGLKPELLQPMIGSAFLRSCPLGSGIRESGNRGIGESA